jgi:hypothetical protein
MDETGVFLLRCPIGGPGEVGLVTMNFENSLKEGSGCGVSPYMGALLGEPGGGCFAGGPKGFERKALGTGISSWELCWATRSGLIYQGL